MNEKLRQSEDQIQKLKLDFEGRILAFSSKYGVAKEKITKAKSLIKNVNSENALYNQTLALLITIQKVLEKESGLKTLLGDYY